MSIIQKYFNIKAFILYNYILLLIIEGKFKKYYRKNYFGKILQKKLYRKIYRKNKGVFSGEISPVHPHMKNYIEKI